MKLKSTAKINLYLDITGVDNSDGYHYIDSIFQEISLADDIEIEKANKDRIIFENIKINEKRDGATTVHLALSLFKKKFGIKQCFKITVNKNIPMGAGLGGGSSNAAFVLMGLADICNIDTRECLDIGAQIGSDVPYFFYGGICRVQGKGEIIQQLDIRLNNAVFLVIYPGIHISTKWAYSLIDNYESDKKLDKKIDKFIKNTAFNLDFFANIIYNKFQFFVLCGDTRLKSIKDHFDELLTTKLSFMSGSGSSLVYIYDDVQTADNDAKIVRKSTLAKKCNSFRVFVCEAIYR